MFKRVQRGRGKVYFNRIQRGQGLGNILKSIFKVFRKAIPIASKIASNPTVKKIGKEVLNSGLRIGGEALITNDLNSAVNTELESAKKRVGKAILKRARGESELNSSNSKKKRKMRFAQSGGGRKKTSSGKNKKTRRKNKVKRKNKTRKTKNKKKIKKKKRPNREKEKPQIKNTKKAL